MMRTLFLLGVAAACVAAPQVALAQANPAGAGDDAERPQAETDTPAEDDAPPSVEAAQSTTQRTGQLEAIVVTGRKRSRGEELQRVPVAITALSAAQLQQGTTRDLVDIGQSIPSASLQSSAQRGVQNFSIRGTGISGTTPSDEPAVGIFQDGVYWGSNYGALNELVDLEGVEILRGPQGTLFGRNVTGGAVAVRSARPSEDPYYRVTLGVDNGPGVEGSAVANGRLADGLAGRVALLSRATDGLFRNITTDSSFGKRYVRLVRPSVKWEASPAFDVTLLGEYYEANGDPVAVRGISPRTIGAVPNLAEQAGFVTSDDFSELQVGDRGDSRVKVYFAMAEANWQIGPGTLTSITGYRKVQSRNLTDFDGFPVNGFLQLVVNDQHQISEELRYAADVSDWLGFTAGVYYFDQSLDFAESRDLSNGATRVGTRSELENSSYAAFAEADVRPIEGLTVTLGARYTHEEKEALSAPFGSCPFDLDDPCTLGSVPTYEDENFSPKIGLAYQIDDGKLIYGSYTQGYRSGGYSLRGTPLGAPYGAETVEAWEAGLKTEWLDRRLRFNIAGYYNEFADLQRNVLGVDPVLGVVQSVFNAADATIKGIEVELVALPMTGLTLSGSYGYTDASYETFEGFADPESLEFVRVPKHNGNASIDYEHPLANGGKLGFHLGAAYTGKYYFDDPNLLSQDDYWLFDAKLFYGITEQLTLELYGRNLTDTEYNVWGSSLGVLGENRFPGDPRSYGVRLAFTY